MEWRRPWWLRHSDKKASEVTKQCSPTLVLSTCLPSLSLSPPSFALLSPWTEDWHSAEDTPGWRLKEVELMCEFKRQCTKGGKRGGGVELVAGCEWHSFWWSADTADSQSFFLLPPALLLFYSSPFISLSLSYAHSLGSYPLTTTLLSSNPPWPYCFTSLHSGFYGCFVLVQTHLPTGWWVPPPVIVAIYYQHQFTSHFSDFG